MKVLGQAVIATLVGLSSVSVLAAPDQIYIEKVRAAGSGCPTGSAYIDISPDKQVFTAIFDEFQAIIDPNDRNVRYSDRHKRCDLAVKVHVPQGWQFSVFQADYEGWYDLQGNYHDPNIYLSLPKVTVVIGSVLVSVHVVKQKVVSSISRTN